MMSRLLLSAVACVALLCTGMEESEVNLDGVKCAVNADAPAKAAKFASYRDANVYFCCGGCKGKFTADNAAYATAANHQLVKTGQYEQKMCPISGRAINPAQKSTVGGVEVSYCCGGCKSQVENAADDAAKSEKVFSNAAFDKGFAKVAAAEGE